MVSDRNLKIIELHKQGWTYNELANEYGVSRARIGQICFKHQPVTFYCKKHNRKYTKDCYLCRIDKHYNEVLRTNGNIKDEIKELRKPDRQMEKVRKRQILIMTLYDDFHFSFRRIAQLLNRHNSSIGYLYYKIKGRKESKVK